MNENEKLLERLKALELKYNKAVSALDFIAFSNTDIWKPKDRMEKAKNTLLALEEIVPYKRPVKPPLITDL